MSGARDLTRAEVKAILAVTANLRNKALLVLGFNTGFRIRELLSLKIKDVYNLKQKTVRNHVTVEARNMKNNKSRTIKLNSDAAKVLLVWCKELVKQGYTADDPLFVSRETSKKSLVINGVEKICVVFRSITARQVNNILKDLADLAGIDALRFSTHSFRKTFAKAIYLVSGRDLTRVQYALGHSSVTTTIKYLLFAITEIDTLVEGISYE